VTTNRPWRLESFVDALVVELDKTREVLGVKAINKPVSYTVKDMAVDLQIFPTYDGREVEFVTAQPGQEGSSTITMQLASITDRQVRESTKAPAGVTEVAIDEVEDLDEDVRHELRRVGVRSIEDLRRIEERKVDLGSVVGTKVSYRDLADKLRTSRRPDRPPQVRSASLSRRAGGDHVVDLEGTDLAVDPRFEPVAVINGELVRLVGSTVDTVTFECPDWLLRDGDNEVVLVLDPSSVVRLNVRHQEREMVR
jgi:hypothetical protein